MALFADGSVSSIDDLTAQDSQLLSVASSEGIDVTRKLALAQDDISAEITVLLGRMSYVDQVFWVTPAINLGSVVVTPPLRLWHTCRTLEMVYRDAYNSQLNDRYSGKKDQFHEMARNAYEKLILIGLGIASNPVPQAVTPQVTTIPGALSDGTYYVSTAWVNGAGEEGASSTPAVVTITGSTLQVDAGAPPANATGWNVYAGSAPETMVRQNGSLLSPGGTWQATSPLATTGKAPGSGQAPTYFKPIPREILRG